MLITTMSARRSAQRWRLRKAFTLLEVLLSAAIGVLLMAALYVAMQVQLDHAQAGREAVEEGLLVRALLRRMSNDIAPGLAAALPNTPAAGGNNPTTNVNPANTTPPTNTGNTNTTNTNTTNTASTTTSTAPIFNLQGDSQHLILWVSRISSDLSQSQTNQVVSSDVRRITYWLAGGRGSPLGLARQEIKQATSDNAMNSMTADIPDEGSFVIAEEVQSVAFRYFDGTSWQDSWDGTQADTSGASIGPPQAVEITVSILPPNSGSSTGASPGLKTYRHVVAIPTANGATPASTQ
jgi:prepilin-type N-terminal cleavage/methylation domain-containing protein